MEVQREVHEDKGTRLERESPNSNHWHQRLSRGYNRTLENTNETLGELYNGAL